MRIKELLKLGAVRKIKTWGKTKYVLTGYAAALFGVNK